MMMESKQEESDNLQNILHNHAVPDKCYNKLIEEGFGSIELLSQCTESDVEQLCNQLALTLVDKLKLKQALQTINIPKQPIKYAVIHQDEQDAILDIHQSIQKVENLIIEKNTNNAIYSEESQNKLGADKQRICAVFDAVHQMIDQRKESIFNELEQNFEDQNNRTQDLVKYLEEAKNARSSCQKLVIKKNHLARSHTISNVRDECLANLTKILQTDPTITITINDDIAPIQALIDNLVIIHKQNKSDVRQQKQALSDSNSENVDSSNQWRAKPFTNPFGSFDSPATSVAHLKSLQKNKTNAANAQHTFKPVVSLKEQNVETGHENEELIGSFKVAKVYNFGRDAMAQPTWKLRAAQTEIAFYRNSSNKTRLVCREFQTEKLRVNHFVPSSDIAKLNCKSDKLIIWAAYDVTIQDNCGNNTLSTFCAKFPDAQTAAAFRSCFENCQTQ